MFLYKRLQLGFVPFFSACIWSYKFVVLYSNPRAQVLSGQNYFPLISVSRSSHQGCMLSPVQFVLYRNIGLRNLPIQHFVTHIYL